MTGVGIAERYNTALIGETYVLDPAGPGGLGARRRVASRFLVCANANAMDSTRHHQDVTRNL